MCFNNNIFLIKKITKYNNNIPYFYFKLNGIFSGTISHHSNICLRTKSYRFKVVKKIKNKNKHSIILKRIYIYICFGLSFTSTDCRKKIRYIISIFSNLNKEEL